MLDKVKELEQENIRLRTMISAFEGGSEALKFKDEEEDLRREVKELKEKLNAIKERQDRFRDIYKYRSEYENIFTPERMERLAQASSELWSIMGEITGE